MNAESKPARYGLALSVPAFLPVILTALLGRLPMGMASLAVLLFVHGTSGSYSEAGAAVGAYALATGVATPLQGRLIDRFGRGRILVPVAAAQALAFVALVLAADGGASGAVVVAISALAGAVLPSVAPTVRALIGELFTEPVARESAYMVDSIIQEAIWITGPLLVAAVADLSSPSTAVLLVGMVGGVGTLAFTSLSAVRRRPSTSRHPAGRRRGARLLPRMRGILVPTCLVGVAVGAMQVGLPALALHSGKQSESALLLAVWSIGGVVGGLAYGSRQWQRGLRARYRILLLIAIPLTLPLMFVRSLPAAVIGSGLAGLPGTAMFACQYALADRVAPRGLVTETFAWMSAGVLAGAAGGSAISGAGIAQLGVAFPFAAAALAYALAAILVLGPRDRGEIEAPRSDLTPGI